MSEKNTDYLIKESEFIAQGFSNEAKMSQVVFARGKGSFVYDLDGKKYLDFSSGILTNSLGHCHDTISCHLKEQIDTLWNVFDYPSEYRLKLMRLLKTYMPKGIDNFAFLTSGSEAVEAAIRTVVQCFGGERITVASLNFGYHGATEASRLLVDFSRRAGIFDNSVQVPPAYCYRCFFGETYPFCDMQCAKTACRMLEEYEAKAFTFEPILGASGIIIPPLEYWEIINNHCRRLGIIMIADEILTSGGRIGTFLACNHYHIDADIIIMAKGLSSGFPFSVVAGKKEIMNNEITRSGGWFSATYSSHPFGIRAAYATLLALEQEKIFDNVLRLSDVFKENMMKLYYEFECIGDIRVIGLLCSVEFVHDKNSKLPDVALAEKVFKHSMMRGLKFLINGAIIRFSPPLNITEADLLEGITIFHEALNDLK